MNNVRRDYTRSINKKFYYALLCHPILFAAASLAFNSSLSQTLFISVLILIGPTVALYAKLPERLTANIMAVAGIMFSGLLIHVGKGMIEMHFHIFAFLGCLTLYGMFSPILSATVAVVIHHVGFFFLLPESLFNYDASFWIVLLHAAFVVMEVVGVLYVAKKFGLFIEAQGGSLAAITDVSNLNTTASNNLSRSAQSLSSSAQQQATSLAQMSSSLKDVNSSVDQNTQNLDTTLDLVGLVHDEAQKGNQTMSQLENGVDQMSSSISELGIIVELIASIGQKVLVINDIVMKTQLLSFNASIEAARAGQHGRGFAVVAEEVGQLAQNSGAAAREIESLLSGSEEKVNRIVGEIQSNVGNASGTMKSASEQFHNIFNRVKEVDEHIKQLGQTNKDSRQALQEFFQAINNIEGSANENNRTAREVEELAEETKDQAAKLQGILHEINDQLSLVKKVS